MCISQEALELSKIRSPQLINEGVDGRTMFPVWFRPYGSCATRHCHVPLGHSPGGSVRQALLRSGQEKSSPAAHSVHQVGVRAELACHPELAPSISYPETAPGIDQQQGSDPGL